jgi:hypothetical protein
MSDIKKITPEYQAFLDHANNLLGQGLTYQEIGVVLDMPWGVVETAVEAEKLIKRYNLRG